MEAQQAKLEQLPVEMLEHIFQWLTLDDLKALTLTSKRVGAVADRIISRRPNVYLHVNRRRCNPPRLEVISQQITDRSHRMYKNLAMMFDDESVAQELIQILHQLQTNIMIERMHITSGLTEPICVVTQIACRKLTELTVVIVRVWNSIYEYYGTSPYFFDDLNYLPALKTLNWTDRYRRAPHFRIPKMLIYAPSLRTLQQTTSFPDLDHTVCLRNDEGFAEEAYRKVRKLVISLTEEFQATLASQVLPKLRYFECTVHTARSPSFWRRLGTAMPTITHLKARSAHEKWTIDMFAGCRWLRTIELQGGQMELTAGSHVVMRKLRQLCLTHCKLSDANCTLQFPYLNTLCLVKSRRNTFFVQDWMLPRLRNLCIEASGSVGINIGRCLGLQYYRLIVKGPMTMTPGTMPLNKLTTLVVECQWLACGDELSKVLKRAPNLQRLMLFMCGCNLSRLVNLPRWCPRLQSVIIQTQCRTRVIEHDVLRAIFSLPAVEEIILGTMKVVAIDAPITIPRQLRVLIIQKLFSVLTELPVFTIDADHPRAEFIEIRPTETRVHRFYTVNESNRQAHLRWIRQFDPFRCDHVEHSFKRWLSP